MKETPHPSSGIKRSVQDQFGQVAANYSVSTVHSTGDELSRMAEIAAELGAEEVLDAGCGPGHTALALAPFVHRVVALDLSEPMIREGRRLAAVRQIKNVEFRLGDVEELPFEDDSFDLVTSRYSAHHWPNPPAALHEFRRLLRPGRSGRAQLLLADVVSFDDFSQDTHLQAIELLRDPSHVRDHTPRQWLAMLDAAGFRAEIDQTWDLAIDFDSWVKRMATPPASIAMIRSLFHNAPDEVRQALKLQADGSFSFRCALLRAQGQDA